MRLPLERHLRPIQKLVLRAFEAMVGAAPGPVLIASYNKPFFGNGWAPCMKKGMRGATEWSLGENRAVRRLRVEDQLVRVLNEHAHRSCGEGAR